MEAQRYPEDYDGIISLCPAINWHRLLPADSGRKWSWLPAGISCRKPSSMRQPPQPWRHLTPWTASPTA